MKRTLFALAALSLVAAPALAGTTAKAPTPAAQSKKLGKHSNLAGAKVTKASAKTAPKAAAPKRK